jgi:hypothetical protein
MTIDKPDGEYVEELTEPDGWPHGDEGKVFDCADEYRKRLRQLTFDGLEKWQQHRSSTFDGDIWAGEGAGSSDEKAGSWERHCGDEQNRLIAAYTWNQNAAERIVEVKNKVVNNIYKAQNEIAKLKNEADKNSDDPTDAVNAVIKKYHQLNVDAVKAAAGHVPPLSEWKAPPDALDKVLAQKAPPPPSPLGESWSLDDLRRPTQKPPTAPGLPITRAANQDAGITNGEPKPEPAASPEVPPRATNQDTGITKGEPQPEPAASPELPPRATNQDTGITAPPSPPAPGAPIPQPPPSPTTPGQRPGMPAIQSPGSPSSSGSPSGVPSSPLSGPMGAPSSGGPPGTPMDPAASAGQPPGGGGHDPGQGQGLPQGPAGAPSIPQAPTAPAAGSGPDVTPAAATGQPATPAAPGAPPASGAPPAHSGGGSGGSVGAAPIGAGLGSGGPVGAMPLGPPPTPSPAAPVTPTGTPASAPGAPGVHPASASSSAQAPSVAPAPIPVTAARAEKDLIAQATAAGALQRKARGNDPLMVAKRIAAALNAPVRFEMLHWSFFWVTAVTTDGQIVVANSVGMAYIPEGIKLPERVCLVSADRSVPVAERARWTTYPFAALQGWRAHRGAELRAVIATRAQFHGYDPGAPKIYLEPEDIPAHGTMAGRDRLEVVAPKMAAQLAKVKDWDLYKVLDTASADPNPPADQRHSLWLAINMTMNQGSTSRGHTQLKALHAYAAHCEQLALSEAYHGIHAEAERAAVIDWYYWRWLHGVLGEALAGGKAA